MILALKIAVISFVFSEILTSEGMIFSFMRRLPQLFTCPYCIAGQLALWSLFVPAHWIEILFHLSLPIVIIHVFLILNERCQENSGDSNGSDKAGQAEGGGEVPIEHEKEVTE